MNNYIVGWDVGGAHLKAALFNAEGAQERIMILPCELWRGLDRLEAGIATIMQSFASTIKSEKLIHAITMTGELVDLFPNRRAGVLAIGQLMASKLTGSVNFYTGAKQADFRGFVGVDALEDHWSHIASANWLATATDIARRMRQVPGKTHGVLIDIGSTTTDFVLLRDFKPECYGSTDAERMQMETLVYTGVIRTPLMAICQKIGFKNQLTSVAAEHFATTADVYRLTEDLLPGDDLANTADGMEKTTMASARRIARMIGRDVEEADLASWQQLAHAFKTEQLERLAESLQKHLAQLNARPEQIVILGAGVGHFLARTLAQKFQLSYRSAASLMEDVVTEVSVVHAWTSTALSAAALASLAHRVFVTNQVLTAH